MKRQIIAIALLTLSGAAQAQNTFINEQLTNNSQDVIGTSRFVGMGGAMGALGADLGVLEPCRNWPLSQERCELDLRWSMEQGTHRQ